MGRTSWSKNMTFSEKIRIASYNAQDTQACWAAAARLKFTAAAAEDLSTKRFYTYERRAYSISSNLKYPGYHLPQHTP